MEKICDKVLFLDDDELVLKAFNRNLRKRFRIKTISDPLLALDKIKSESYAVVIVDYKMPILDGIKFLNLVSDISPATKRIMLTGRADLEVAKEAVNVGKVFKFLTKPITNEELISTITKALDQYRTLELKKLKDNELKYKAFHDSLTGLPNRIYFKEKLKDAIAEAKRNKTMVGVLFIDLDKFKKLNDNYGHEIGDHILKSIAEVLKENIRETDTAARFAGDEFMVIMQHINGSHDVEVLCERIIPAIERIRKINKIAVETKASIGFSIFPLHSESVEMLIEYADKAMYKSKDKGGSAFTQYGY